MLPHTPYPTRSRPATITTEILLRTFCNIQPGPHQYDPSVVAGPRSLGLAALRTKKALVLVCKAWAALRGHRLPAHGTDRRTRPHAPYPASWRRTCALDARPVGAGGLVRCVAGKRGCYAGGECTRLRCPLTPTVSAKHRLNYKWNYTIDNDDDNDDVHSSLPARSLTQPGPRQGATTRIRAVRPGPVWSPMRGCSSRRGRSRTSPG